MQHTDRDAPPRRAVGKAELFLGFLKIGLLGFGGVGPQARHIIVQERRWLGDREFAELLGVGQMLPGPNTVNAAVLIGDRFQGPAGVVASLLGMMAMPLLIVTMLAVVYDRFADLPEVGAGLGGAAAPAAGLVLGTAIKMIRNVRLPRLAYLTLALAFVALGVLRWPLIAVVLAVAPVALGLTLLGRRW
ncbi:chromate transporter [Reyranella sp.]|uniref:chromate transporter n=1 Tax=Reyranella sp. TaxID=1929291 RepID=UPI003BAB4ADE